MFDITMIHIGRDDEKTDTLLKFLHLVFMSRLTEAEREAHLKKDFGIELWDETREGLSDMCNLSQGLKDESREEGRIEEQKNTILRLLKDGKGADIMAAATGWTIEHVQSFLKSQNLQPAQ